MVGYFCTSFVWNLTPSTFVYGFQWLYIFMNGELFVFKPICSMWQTYTIEKSILEFVFTLWIIPMSLWYSIGTGFDVSLTHCLSKGRHLHNYLLCSNWANVYAKRCDYTLFKWNMLFPLLIFNRNKYQDEFFFLVII